MWTFSQIENVFADEMPASPAAWIIKALNPLRSNVRKHFRFDTTDGKIMNTLRLFTDNAAALS